MSFTPLITALTQGATIITPTNRLARDLQWLYCQAQTNPVMIKPKCFSYENWLLHWYQELQLQQPQEHIFLNEWQWQFLWQSHCDKALKHFELAAFLTAVKNSYLCQSPPQGSDFSYTPMAHIFLDTWQKVTQQPYLSHHNLAQHLQHRPYYDTQAHLIWVCFDGFYPQQQALLEHLQHLKLTLEFYDLNHDYPVNTHLKSLQFLQHPSSTCKAIYHLHATTREQEQEQLCRWVQARWQQGYQRIAIVVADLESHKETLYRELNKFIPEHALHCSLGHALNEFPIIQQILQLLCLDPQQRLLPHQIQLLLQQRHIAGYTNEQDARLRLAMEHRLLQEPELSWIDFLNMIQHHCPVLHNILLHMQPYPHTAMPATWVTLFEQRLQLFQFATQQTLEHELHILINKFTDTLENLHFLEIFGHAFNLQEVQAELQYQLKQHIHQAPHDYYGVHIIGCLEASGFNGDAIWITDFLSQYYPQTVHFSPWLPINWQKQHHFPRCDPLQETQITQLFLQRLIHGNQNIIFSSAQVINDQIQWPSALIPREAQPYPLQTESFPLPSTQVTPIIDPLSLPLNITEPIRKSSQILSDYAKCPFLAFAKHRLQTQAPLTENLGLNPLERGQILHQCLYEIWDYLTDHATLIHLHASEQQQLISTIIQGNLQKLQPNKPYSFDPILTELEYQHLHQVINQVLIFDAQRPPFKIIGLEQQLSLQIEDWEFTLRYDRLDQLSTGELCLIDYKTKIPSPLPWNQERPIHSQILMYALAKREIKVLMFMELGIQACHSSGIAAIDTQIPGVKVAKQEWSKLQQQWYQYFKDSIYAIQQGDYQPKPYSTQICQQCIYQDLCRY